MPLDIATGSSAPDRSLIPPTDQASGAYRLRFARTRAELEAAQRLRYQVFNLELGEGLASAHASGLDRDRFDPQCQHLLVIHEVSGEVIGTYRLQTREAALRGAGFYSAQEFDLSGFPDSVLAGAVELGRACIHRRHRSGRVLQLLWRGLRDYAEWNEKEYLFGCNSLTSQDPCLGVRFHQQLRAAGFLHPEFQIAPLPGWECTPSPGAVLPRRVKTPKLFRRYLWTGARVCSPPALDREFGTIDFLTLLHLRQVDPSVHRTVEA